MHYSAELLDPHYFLDWDRDFPNFRRIYVRSAAGVITAHGRGHVRINTLRLFPAAAAEWAKPKEIRRGTSP